MQPKQFIINSENKYENVNKMDNEILIDLFFSQNIGQSREVFFYLIKKSWSLGKADMANAYNKESINGVYNVYTLIM